MEELDEILYIYEKLKDKYDLTLTTAFALDEGYTEDFTMLCGEGKCGSFRLYDCDILTMDVVLKNGEHTHTHCLYGDYAVEDVIAFMEGTHWHFS